MQNGEYIEYIEYGDHSLFHAYTCVAGTWHMLQCKKIHGNNINVGAIPWPPACTGVGFDSMP